DGHVKIAKKYLALLAEAGALSGDTQDAVRLAALDRNGRELDRIEASLRPEDATAWMLADRGDEIDVLGTALQALSVEIEQDPSKSDAALQQARRLALRADMLANRIAELRRGVVGGLFARTFSVLSPAIWMEA